MDRNQFDTLARLVSTRQSRRAALATLLGAAVLRSNPGAALAKKIKKRGRVEAAAANRCYPGTRCTPGPGRNASRCDFAFSTVFRNRDVRGSNLSKSSFRGADLRGADFRGANLSGGCFVGADLLGAKLGSSVNLHKAIFCNTRMPDGSINTSGCDKTTACCSPLERDCPPTTVQCYSTDSVGDCVAVVHQFDTVATCGDVLCCAPCESADPQHWNDRCNREAPACNGGCRAVDDAFFGCLGACPGIL
jgi:hypothetical protein